MTEIEKTSRVVKSTKTRTNQHIMAIHDTYLALFVRCCDTYVDIRNEQGET